MDGQRNTINSGCHERNTYVTLCRFPAELEGGLQLIRAIRRSHRVTNLAIGPRARRIGGAVSFVVVTPLYRVRLRSGYVFLQVSVLWCARAGRTTSIGSVLSSSQLFSHSHFAVRPTGSNFEYCNIAPSRNSRNTADDTVPAIRTRRVWRLVKDADLWPSRRERTTFANHFTVSPASQKGDTIYMKFLDTVSPSLSRARSGSCKKLIEPFIGPATRCMSSLKYQGFSFRNLLEQDIKILQQPTQKIATIQGNVTGYT
ncbi:hypothetical protein QTP88_005741 [Uroleucon formosanum]